ncbi:MAG TPA: hypothetical protein PKD86_09635 [Gemmatales bacterium]|nr:hypothetical protein [Gemmatales bacterium]HMP59602.1 hypothetical protein [Gemmatales bacterium]
MARLSLEPVTPRLVAWIGLFLLAWPSVGGAQSPPFWGDLKLGPFAVGYRSTWKLDYSRLYAMALGDRTTQAPGKVPRPILFNVWYPATRAAGAKPMLHRDYLAISSDQPHLAKFSTQLAEYNLGVIAQEVLGKSLAELSEHEKEALQRLLDTPTACILDATPQAGPFPLVLYHSGAGSSFEDNAVLCEFLASHGFVVVGSAFQQQSGRSFNTDNREGSARDLDFLIAQAAELPFVDWQHIGLIGHSAGAQAALRFRAQPQCPVDAMVCLDTTQDYHSISNPLWDYPAHVLKNQARFTGPLLMVAGPGAFFELADALRQAPRYYLTLPNLSHNDYISQGLWRRESNERLSRGEPSPAAADRLSEQSAREQARHEYQALNSYILLFLQATLKGEPRAQELLAKEYRTSKIGTAPHVEFVPVGRTGPDAYTDAQAEPPTPRQFRALVREEGSAKAIVLLRRLRTRMAKHPISQKQFQLAVVGDLLDQGSTEHALAFRDYYREFGLDCGTEFLSSGNDFHRMGLSHVAAMLYRRVLLLDPSCREAADKLREINEKGAAARPPD